MKPCSAIRLALVATFYLMVATGKIHITSEHTTLVIKMTTIAISEPNNNRK